MQASLRLLIYIFFRRVRESRNELRKFMRDVKRQNPAANVVLQYDKLFVNHRCYIWNDIQGQVIEHTPVSDRGKKRKFSERFRTERLTENYGRFQFSTTLGLDSVSGSPPRTYNWTCKFGYCLLRPKVAAMSPYPSIMDP